MTETRDVLCPVCGIILASVTLPENISEGRWSEILASYVHTECQPIEDPPIDV